MTALKPEIKKDGELSSVEKLFEVKKNQIKMMSRRGYHLDEEDKTVLNMNLDEFLVFLNAKTKNLTLVDIIHCLNKLYFKKLPNGTIQKNYVYYISPNKSGKKICTTQNSSLVDFSMALEDVKKIDVIADREIHNLSKSELIKLKTKNFKIWLYDELIYDIFESGYVPIYKILTQEQIRNIFFNEEGKPLISKSKLPYLCIDDPVTKYLNLEIGDIVQYTDDIIFVPAAVHKMIKFKQVVGSSIEKES